MWVRNGRQLRRFLPALLALAVAATGASWAPSPVQAQNAPSRACENEREGQKRVNDEINRLGREMGRTGDPVAREALREQIRRVMGERRAIDQRLYACMREDQRKRMEEQQRVQEQRRTDQMRQQEQRQQDIRKQEQRRRGEPPAPGTTDLPEQRPQENQGAPPPPPGRSPSQPKPPSG